MPLTNMQVKNAKPRGKPYKISDGKRLYLYVTSKGAKLWRMAYNFNGKEMVLSIGPYPEVSLAKARKARDSARELLVEGIDPGAAKQSAKAATIEADKNTFAAVAADWLIRKEKEGLAEVTLQKQRWLLNMAFADFGKMPIRDITAPIILKTLRKVEARGVYETANKLKATIGGIMRHAVLEGLINGDPTPALKGALIRPKVKHLAAITNPQEYGKLLKAIDSFEGHASTRHGLQLMALLFPRPGELRQAVWGEFDLEGAVWDIPATRMKMREDHRIPLPTQAVAILQAQKILTGYGKWVFPAFHTTQRPMSENTMNMALRRLDYTGEQMTSHGFRASFSTIANESRLWSVDAIERALAHKEKDQIRAAYSRGAYWDERVKMAQWWADYLDELRVNLS